MYFLFIHLFNPEKNKNKENEKYNEQKIVSFGPSKNLEYQ